jgi:predicted RNA-binding protein YlqC (UPF0109 family)
MNDDELDRELRERERTWRTQPKPPVAASEDNLETYFKELVGAYVNFPSNLKVEMKEARSWIGETRTKWALMIEPDVSDYAIVAGRRGRNFNALKTLVTAIAEHRGIVIELLLEGPPVEDTRHIRKQLPYRVNPQWTPHDLKELVVKTLRLAGMEHIQLRFQKNKVISENNPFDDQTFYWFYGHQSDAQAEFAFALGQLMESMGIAQGQRLTPRFKSEAPALEKTA